MNKWVAILIILISCTPTKPYRKVASDTDVTPKKKAIIAPFVSMHFPVRERVTSDTVRIVDTVYDEKTTYILSTIIDSLIMRGKDTIRLRDKRAEARLVEQLKVAKKECGRVITIKETIKDTIWQEDEAKTFAMRDYITKLEAKNGTLTHDLEVADKKVSAEFKRANTLLFMFIGALLVIAFLIWLIIKTKR